MLHLKRKRNDAVNITIPPGVYPEGLTLDVVVRGFYGNSVSLGFDGPLEIQIWRKELLNGTPPLRPSDLSH